MTAELTPPGSTEVLVGLGVEVLAGLGVEEKPPPEELRVLVGPDPRHWGEPAESREHW